jgi:polyhydroxyalkanoate synthesis repressor PhaR
MASSKSAGRSRTSSAHAEPSANSGAAAEPATPTVERLIKKYPNRRLYDTTTSAYITLTEVKDMVMAHQRVRVQDAKTGEDLTRSILLQIILEEEAAGSPLFSENVLASFIRFYGHAMQGFVGPYMERSMQVMLDAQTRLSEQARHNAQAITPDMWAQFLKMPSPMGPFAEQGTQWVNQVQEQVNRQTEQMMSAFGLKPTGGSGKSS